MRVSGLDELGSASAARRFPLAVPDFAYARDRSRKIDRGANPYSLHPPLAALVGVAQFSKR